MYFNMGELMQFDKRKNAVW